jgi:hypothetical protein
MRILHIEQVGALVQQGMFGIALALFCSTKNIPVLDSFMANKYSTNDATHHLNKMRRQWVYRCELTDGSYTSN